MGLGISARAPLLAAASNGGRKRKPWQSKRQQHDRCRFWHGGNRTAATLQQVQQRLQIGIVYAARMVDITDRQQLTFAQTFGVL